MFGVLVVVKIIMFDLRSVIPPFRRNTLLQSPATFYHPRFEPETSSIGDRMKLQIGIITFVEHNGGPKASTKGHKEKTTIG